MICYKARGCCRLLKASRWCGLLSHSWIIRHEWGYIACWTGGASIQAYRGVSSNSHSHWYIGSRSEKSLSFHVSLSPSPILAVTVTNKILTFLDPGTPIKLHLSPLLVVWIILIPSYTAIGSLLFTFHWRSIVVGSLDHPYTHWLYKVNMLE